MEKPDIANIFDDSVGRIEPERAAIENAIARGSRRLSVALDAARIFFRFNVLETFPEDAALWADFRIQRRRCRVMLDDISFLPTIGVVLAEAPVPEALPPDLVTAALEYVFASASFPPDMEIFLDAAGLGKPSRPFTGGGKDPWRLSLQVENDAGACLSRGVFHCGQETAALLAAVIDAPPAGTAARGGVEPGAVGRIQLPSIHVAPDAYEGLAPLDILLLGAYGLGGRIAVRLFFAPGVHFVGILNGEVISMDLRETETNPVPAQPEPADLDKLPVRIGFELASVTVTLAELQRMAEGTVVEIPAPLDSPVVLRANGREIGRGALLRVGDHAGVRILELYRKAR